MMMRKSKRFLLMRMKMNNFIEKYGKKILIIIIAIMVLFSAIKVFYETAPYDSAAAYERRYGDARSKYGSDYYAKHPVKEKSKSKAKENLRPDGHGYSIDSNGNIHYGP